MKTAHQLARELLEGPDLPIFHFDPSRAGCDDERDTSISDPEIQEVDPKDGLTDEEVAENKQEGCNTDPFLTICGESDEDGEAMTIRESDRVRALEMLSSRVHSGYDFNADPDNITLIVGAAIRGDPRVLTPPEQEELDKRISAAWDQFILALKS